MTLWTPETNAKRNKRPRKHPEYDLQVAVVRFLETALPHDIVWTHIANGEKRPKATAARLKRMGVRRGAPDFVFVKPETGHVWIELKAGKGKATSLQRYWMDAINAAPESWAFVCNSIESVERALRSCDVPLRASVIGYKRLSWNDINQPLEVGDGYGG